MTVQEYKKRLTDVIVWDPKNLAPSVDPAKVLLVFGLLDTVVPFAKGQELKRSMGNPETVVLFGGHYSSILYMWHIENVAREFLLRKFGDDTRFVLKK